MIGWSVEKEPASTRETATFLRDQIERMLRRTRRGDDRPGSGELLSLAAFLYEKVQSLEGRCGRDGACSPSSG